MRSSHFRKSLAASAILATSVASAAGLVPSASASTAGAANSPLTVTNGTQNVVLNGHSVQYTGNIDQGSWAPDGSRIAYVRADGAVVTERAGGSGVVVVAPAKAGVTRSHPTWFAGGTTIVFAEKTGGTSKLMAVPAFTADGGTPTETDPVTWNGVGTPLAQGTEAAPDSNGRLIAFQHQDAGTGHQQIWVQDFFGRGSDGSHLAADDGTDPTLSPDGKTLAFLRTDGSGNKQIWSVAFDASDFNHALGTPVQLTHDAHDHLSPTFSPDGSRIAYEQGPGHGATATDVQSIAKDGSGQRQEWNAPGDPAYQGRNQDSVTRLAGDDRLGTAIAASQAAFKKTPSPSQGGANSVVLSRSDQFADALGGSTLAAADDGPLLLTPTDHLDPAVKAEMIRVLGPATTQKTVYILGGEKALSPAVYNAVKALGYSVKRIAGGDRYETSVAIAKEVAHLGGSGGDWAQPQRVLVATGNNAPDALSAGAAAEESGSYGRSAGVVILSNDKTLPASTAAYLAEVKAHNTTGNTATVYGVGGQADTALTNAGIKHTPVAGADRYQTSYLVAKTFFSGALDGGTPPSQVGFATGLTWPDALSGGAFMGHKGGPLLLVDPVGGEPAKDAELWLLGWSGSISDAYVFGGTKAVPEITVSGVADLIAGPGGAATPLNPKA